MSKKIFFIVLTVSSFFSVHPSSPVDEIQNAYKNSLLLVESLRLEHAKNDYNSMISLYSCFDQPLQALIKQLRQDMRIIQLAIKKEGADSQILYQQLQGLYEHLKKHKVIYNAVSVHNAVAKRYQVLFDMIDSNQDIVVYIEANKEFFELQNFDNNYLRTFLKKLKVVRSQISKIEDYVHSDYVDLKLQNYVFKIELTKLRNAILFDKRYKIQ